MRACRRPFMSWYCRFWFSNKWNPINSSSIIIIDWDRSVRRSACQSRMKTPLLLFDRILSRITTKNWVRFGRYKRLVMHKSPHRFCFWTRSFGDRENEIALKKSIKCNCIDFVAFCGLLFGNAIVRCPKSVSPGRPWFIVFHLGLQ